MNILFITLFNVNNVDEHNIYTDLIRELAKNNQQIYVISPFEKRFNEKERLARFDGSNDFHTNIHLLKLRVGNIQKTNFIEKGISTLLIEYKLKKGIKRYFKDIKFDLVLYSTPPITLIKPIKYIKKCNNAKTYLMLKDIFPQNAVDLNIIRKNSLIYKYFRRKEIELYKISDKIGCMSKANVDYILKNNKYLARDKVEIFANSIEPYEFKINESQITKIHEKYNIPFNKKLILCGGNFGKPQDVKYIVESIKSLQNNNKIHFVMCGSGTDFYVLEDFKNNNLVNNLTVIPQIANYEYNKLVMICDIGLITLDYRFTIPNFPSRLLNYLVLKKPVIVCADEATDLTSEVRNNKFGWTCKSNDINSLKMIFNNENVFKECESYGINGYKYLIQNYNVKKSMKRFLK